MIRIFACGVIAIGLAAVTAIGSAHGQVPDGDWQSYGRDQSGTRFSPLSQITPDNVTRLRRAWTYSLRPSDRADARLMVSVQVPLAVDGMLYLATPDGRIVALDGITGTESWTYKIPTGDTISGRGIEYWPGKGRVGARIFYGTRDGKLAAVDVRTGRAPEGFTTIDLKTPDVMNGAPDASYQINSAPIVFDNVVVTGSRVQESPELGPSGDVRGWDAVTGKLLWTFHSVPRPGEPGYASWGAGSTQRRSGVNVWNLMSVDRARGIVYLPFGAPAYDRIGVDRPGDNLYSSSLVALDARTGRKLWHFQTVHHDIWDHDLPGQPTLFDMRQNGRTIPVVAAVNKTGYIFLLDRRNGKPVYPVREVAVPPSAIPGEHASPTQPVPLKPPPISRQGMTLDDVSDLTPEHRQFCMDKIKQFNLTFAGPFDPLRSDHPTVRFPGSGGGPNLGGGAFDPKLGYYVINTTETPSVEQMGKDEKGVWYNVSQARGFTNPANRWFCHKGPWGQITAVDVNRGTIAWQVPLGVTDDAPAGKQATGARNIGGPIMTASGLTFVAATTDARFRAFDTRTGKELWTEKLGASAHGTPISYRSKDGRQYVALVVAGGSYMSSPATVSELAVYALPR